MLSRQAAIAYAQKNRGNFENDLVELLKIPSISSQSTHSRAVEKASENVAGLLIKAGAKKVNKYPTPGHPIIFGEFSAEDPIDKTVLIYGHYDVQPVDPLDEWLCDPFSPMVNGDNLYARGASDMKGPIVAAIKAVEALSSQKQLPVNIKFLIEGEEEIGSPHLPSFIVEKKDLLSCNVSLNTDTEMVSIDNPTIIYALRGLAYFELKVVGPAHDLHSGVYGGTVHNSAQALCELIAKMHDPLGRIQLPGFYDKVRPLSVKERSDLARLPSTEQFFLKHTGTPNLWGEKDFTPQERVGARPTLEINGIYSGYTGEGGKTVIPSAAYAKISMRLVPDQIPQEVHQQFIRFLDANAPDTIRWELTSMRGAPACLLDRDLPAVQSLQNALKLVWNREPVFKREGGGIPVVSHLKNLLGVDTVLTGFGLPDDNIHAPNEKVHLPTWHKGIEAVIHFLYNYAALPERKNI